MRTTFWGLGLLGKDLAFENRTKMRIWVNSNELNEQIRLPEYEALQCCETQSMFPSNMWPPFSWSRFKPAKKTATCFLLCLHSYPEDRREMFLLNLGCLSTECTLVYPRSLQATAVIASDEQTLHNIEWRHSRAPFKLRKVRRLRQMGHIRTGLMRNAYIIFGNLKGSVRLGFLGVSNKIT
jgi:hypothetical protein